MRISDWSSDVCSSDLTPLTALAFQRLAFAAGIPEGAFAVVTTLSAPAVGAELCKNPIVRKLSFTGSTAVGKRLMADCAETVKRLSLELGGNAPFIVFRSEEHTSELQSLMRI